jgi:L-amino acid N-acyltransferase YncA
MLDVAVNQGKQLFIRLMKAEDSEAVLAIYGKGLETRNATFETNVPTWEDWNNNHLFHSRYVALENERIIGWSALTPYSKRMVYQGVAEVSIYIEPDLSGKGIGSTLMDALIQSAKENGIWTLQSSIFPENPGSIALHKKFGFREVGYREKIAQLDGVWRDVVLLEKRF